MQVILIPVSVVSLAVAHYLAYRNGAGDRANGSCGIATPVSIALALPHVLH